jgi:hypothetical protein
VASDSGDLQRAAEDRIRLRFDRQTAALNQWQREERDRDARVQSRAVEDSLTRQADLEAAKTQELAEHDKLWREAKDRLAPRPAPAPAFDMMGGPPSRNLAKDYHDLRLRSDERRERIESDFDQRIGACVSARAEMQHGFARANEARGQAHKEDRRDLAERQQQSFDRLVKKELDRAEKWTSREFKQRSRDGNVRDI